MLLAQNLPQPPTLIDRVELVADKKPLHPVIPPLRTTKDGRVGLNSKGLHFYLLVPEKITKSFIHGPNGPEILADKNPITLEKSKVHGSQTDGNVIHSTLCDVTRQFNQGEVQNNPRTCGDDELHDCYDLKIITSYKHKNADKVELWERPITVMVSSPKTKNAKIESISFSGPAKKGPTLDGFTTLFEPIVSGDNRLLIGRGGHSFIKWNDETGEKHSGNYDVIYSVYSKSNPECDVTQWKQFYPISHAPYHNAMKQRYGFAKNRFRDSFGNTIPDGAEIDITYPWIDKEANNIAFTAVKSELYNQVNGNLFKRYPSKCAKPQNCVAEPKNYSSYSRVERIESQGGPTRGFTIMGLWTNGKMILMDNPINNIDYGIKIADKYQRKIRLYQDRSDHDGWVRIGSGRDTSGEKVPAGNVKNTTFFESTEHLFNFNPSLVPTRPKDVVWLVSSGNRTAEFAFDEYISPKTLIYSPMNGALNLEDGKISYKDGFNLKTGKFDKTAYVQNGSTSTHWKVPTYGKLVGNNIRLEPVSLGGVIAKGLWLNPNNRVEYTVPSQNKNMKNHHWYIGLFIDARIPNDNRERQWLSLPGGGKVLFRGRTRLIFLDKNGEKKVIQLKKNLPFKAWSHIGLSIAPNASQIDIYLDGMRAHSWADVNDPPSFRIRQGKLQLGGELKAWVDEFKVIQEEFSPEEHCNQALGTLVALKSDSNLLDQAATFPNSTHQEIENLLSSNGYPSQEKKFLCHNRYDRVGGVDQTDLPPKSRSIRREILFPESPLVWDRTRPVSQNNRFCLYCHTNHSPMGLHTSALTASPDLMQNDPRRQPMQAPRLMYGNLPVDLFGPESIIHHIQTTNSGVKIDKWLHPPK